MSRELAFTLDDGSPIYRYPNGDLRNAKGHWYQRGKTSAPLFDSVGGKLAIARRHAIKQERIDTLQDEVGRLLVKEVKAGTVEQAGAEIVLDVYKAGKKKDTKPRDKVVCADFVLKHAGMQAKEQVGGPAINLTLTDTAVDRLVEIAGRPRLEVPDMEPGTIEGEWAEADS